MTDCLFIDVSNLNVLMMTAGKFCVGMNYSSCPEKLALDAQALGGSFDVYLSMWPRVPEEADVEIESLRAGSVPFYAIKAEVKAAFGLVERIPGVNNIFLCNALANTVTASRVENFQSVLCYGNRYMFVDVEGKKPREVAVYNNQHEFMEIFGSEYTCYGDLDMVDADALRAQFPELVKWKRSVIIPLAHLILADKTRYHIPMDTARNQMAAWVPPEQRKKAPPKKEVQEAPRNEPVRVYEEERYTHEVRGRVDWVSVLLCIFICVGTCCLGVASRFVGLDQQLATYESSGQVFLDSAEQNNTIQQIYTSSYGMAGRLADILDYAKRSELDVTVSAIDAYNDRVVMQFNCTSVDVQESFAYYMGSRYTLAGVNQYGSVGNTDGTTTYEYGLTLLYQP